jgi:hypothetical protein
MTQLTRMPGGLPLELLEKIAGNLSATSDLLSFREVSCDFRDASVVPLRNSTLCHRSHGFDEWYARNTWYEGQLERAEFSCPLCDGDTRDPGHCATRLGVSRVPLEKPSKFHRHCQWCREEAVLFLTTNYPIADWCTGVIEWAPADLRACEECGFRLTLLCGKPLGDHEEGHVFASGWLGNLRQTPRRKRFRRGTHGKYAWMWHV